MTNAEDGPELTIRFQIAAGKPTHGMIALGPGGAGEGSAGQDGSLSVDPALAATMGTKPHGWRRSQPPHGPLSFCHRAALQEFEDVWK